MALSESDVQKQVRKIKHNIYCKTCLTDFVAFDKIYRSSK